jgi:hypothetical protein
MRETLDAIRRHRALERKLATVVPALSPEGQTVLHLARYKSWGAIWLPENWPGAEELVRHGFAKISRTATTSARYQLHPDIYQKARMYAFHAILPQPPPDVILATSAASKAAAAVALRTRPKQLVIGPIELAAGGALAAAPSLQVRPGSPLFRRLVGRAPLILGRKTWEVLRSELPEGQPLFVLSRDAAFEAEHATVCGSLAEALEEAAEAADEVGVSRIFLIGGASTVSEALPKASRVYVT